MSSSQAAYKQFATNVTLPVVSVVAVLLCSLLVTLLAVADYQTEIARDEQAKLAQGAIRVRADDIERTALDYGAWNDAFENLVLTPDLLWADENIGHTAFSNLGFDMIFVVAPDGSTTFGMIEGRRTPLPVLAVLTRGIDALMDRQRDGARNATASGLIYARSSLAIATVVPIRRSLPAADTGEPQHQMVFVDTIDEEMLRKFSRIYILPQLRLVSESAVDEVSIPLQTADGRPAGLLAWHGARPGDSLLRTAVPLWIGLALGFGLFIALVLRQAGAAVRLIAESDRRATHDALTDLPNRILFFERLDAASRALAAGGPKFAVAYLDLDGFKAVNDTHGHEAGDVVLREIARRIRDVMRSDDFVARLGGDEFALILHGCARPQDVQPLGRSIIYVVERPVELPDGATAAVGATMGATFAPGDASEPLEIMRNADRALYLGKRSGKRQLRFHAGFATASVAV